MGCWSRDGRIVSHLGVLLLVLTSLLTAVSPAQAAGGPAGVPATCPASCHNALVEFVANPDSVVNLTLGGTAQNFNVDILDLAEANNYDLASLATLGDVILQPNATLRVPLPSCSCTKARNYSSDGVTYTVQPGDYLYLIAAYQYGGLLTYEDIANDNGIKNADLIQPDDVFNITIPCTCLKLSNTSSTASVPLAYPVREGDDYSIIGKRFNTSVESIESLNPSVNASDLREGQVLQLALPGCAFNLSSASLDRGLIVPYDAYAITAEACVQCKCSADRKSSCVPAPVALNCTFSAANLTCPGTNLTVGSSTLQTIRSNSSSSCRIRTCVYNGYSGTGILTRLEEKTVAGKCPEPPPPAPAPPPPAPALPPPPTTTPPSPITAASPESGIRPVPVAFAPPPSGSGTRLQTDLKVASKEMIAYYAFLLVLVLTFVA